MIVARQSGFGAWNCEAAPSWCTWLPFADLSEACRVPTPTEIRACQTQDFGPALTPQSRGQAVQQADVTVEAYCQMHPVECADYQRAITPPPTLQDLLLYAALAVGVVSSGLLLLGGRH
jgi:hypothetical protein